MSKFDVKCICDRDPYSHIMDDGCLKYMQEKIIEYTSAQLHKTKEAKRQ